jgi:hypothetical protein
MCEREAAMKAGEEFQIQRDDPRRVVVLGLYFLVLHVWAPFERLRGSCFILVRV